MTKTSADPAPHIPPAALVTLDRAHMAQELLRGIAHDLRNHLQVIALGAALGDADVDGRVEQAIDEMGDLLQLLGQLGRHHPSEPSASDLAASLRLIERMAGFQRNAPAVPLQLRLPATAHRVAMPESALAHALLNLILNAKEASAAADTPVRVSVAARDGTIAISVEDHGAGAPPEAGEAFRSTKPPTTHAGIGLFVARTVVESYGGTLRLGARPGGGCLATLSVPAAA